MTLAVGLLSLLTGIAYTGLGAITAYELARHTRRRGHSHFGFGFLLMAATCGPHHLVHSVHFLFEGQAASAPLLAALAIGRRAPCSSGCASRRCSAAAATASPPGRRS